MCLQSVKLGYPELDLFHIRTQAHLLCGNGNQRQVTSQVPVAGLVQERNYQVDDVLIPIYIPDTLTGLLGKIYEPESKIGVFTFTSSFLVLDKLFSCPVPQFPHGKSGDSTCLRWLAGEEIRE